MSPAQRGAQTRRVRQQTERLRWLRERLAQVREEVPSAFADARQAFLAFCASDPTTLTWESMQELNYAAIWPLGEKFSCIETLTRETAQLTADLSEGEGVIRLFPRGTP